MTGKKVTGLVVHFSAPLASGSAANAANYAVHQLRVGRRGHGRAEVIRSAKAVRIRAVSFVPGASAVTLNFRSPVSAGRAVQLQINGEQGGLTDVNGRPLNSRATGAAGSDYVGTLNG
jgi:hypothetical protein